MREELAKETYAAAGRMASQLRVWLVELPFSGEMRSAQRCGVRECPPCTRHPSCTKVTSNVVFMERKFK